MLLFRAFSRTGVGGQPTEPYGPNGTRHTLEHMMTRFSTRLMITAGLLAAAMTSIASAQGGATCASAAQAQLGVNAYNNASGTSTLNYSGLCDMGAFGDDSNHKAVWFRWTAGETGTFRVSTCNTAGGVDTRLSVQTGCDASTVVACNDDGAGCAGFSSRLTFAATAGQQYYILVGVYSATTAGGPGTFTLEAVGTGGGSGGATCASAAQAVLGDNPYDNSAGTDSIDYAGLCDMGAFGTDTNYNAVWFKWTATATDTFTVSTCNAANGVDTRLSVQSSCDPSSVLACNDDGIGCAGFSSRMSFEATQGVQYYIAVGVYSATTAGGPGTMNIVQGSVSGGGCGEGGSCCEPNFGSVGCKDPECCEAICTADPFCCETEWDDICADEALTGCDVCLVDCPLPTNTGLEQEPCGSDLNGGCNGGGVEYVSALPAAIRGTFWADGDTRDTDWYEVTITQSSTISMSVFSKMPCFAALVDPIACTIVGSVTTGTCPSTGGVCVIPGTYWVVALPQGFNGFPCGSGTVNDYVVQISTTPCDAEPPANDTCDDATVAVVGPNPFDNTFASTDVADPSCGFGGVPFTKDVFFRFTAATAGTYRFETCSGSAPFDTGIEIWDNCPELGGVLVACNDDGTGCAAFSSSVNYAMTANQTVIIRVGGWQGDTGATELVIGAAPAGPGNDQCANATTVQVGSTPYTTAGATDDGPTPSPCDNISFRNDIWFRFTAPATATYRVSLCGSSGDTRLEVSTGCGQTATACSDDFCGLQSEVSFSGTSGTTYTIRVGTWSAGGVATGNLVIENTGGGGGGGGAGLTCAEAIEIPGAGGSVPFNRAGATVDLDFAGLCDMGPFGTDTNFNVVFYRWSPAQSGSYQLSTCNSANHDTRLSVMTNCEVSSVVACNDDGTGCAGFTSQLFFDANCGTQYIIAVGGYSATTTLGTGTMSLSLQSSTGTCSGANNPDLNGDGAVNGLDLTVVLAQWGSCGSAACQADLNDDGYVNGADLTVVLAAWTG